MATLTDPPTDALQSPPKPDQPAPERTYDRFRQQAASAAHRHLIALLGVGATMIVAILVFVVALSGPAVVAPASGAARLVPADALLYVHLSTDRSRPGVRSALALTRRIGGSAALTTGLVGRLGAILTGPINPASFATNVLPWLGREAAFAVLDTPGSIAGSLIVLDVRNLARARASLAGDGAAPDGAYRRVPLLREPSGTVLALVGHYLVLGQAASVASAIDVASGRMPSLAASVAYQRAAAGEPAGRVLDAYASASGVRRALLPRRGLLGTLGMLLDDPALRAVTVSVSAGRTAVQVQIHRALDPNRARASTAAPAPFEPTLDSVLPPRSMLLFDVKSLARGAPQLLAAFASAGVAANTSPLLRRLGSGLVARGVDLHRVLSIFSGETAVAIAPARAGHGPAPVIVTRTQHQAATRALLAGLEGPLTQLFQPPSSGPGQVPEVSDAQVAGVTVHRLSLAPAFELDYAVSHGLVVISTSLGAIGGVLWHSGALSKAPFYRTALGERPSKVTSLLFFDFSQLLGLGEQTGLIGSTRLAALWPYLVKIRAVGLESTRGSSDTTTELYLQIP